MLLARNGPKKLPDRVGRLRTNAEPVLDPLTLDRQPLPLGLRERVVMPQLLDHLTVTGATPIHSSQPIRRAMPTTNSFQSDPDSHTVLLPPRTKPGSLKPYFAKSSESRQYSSRFRTYKWSCERPSEPTVHYDLTQLKRKHRSPGGETVLSGGERSRFLVYFSLSTVLRYNVLFHYTPERAVRSAEFHSSPNQYRPNVAVFFRLSTKILYPKSSRSQQKTPFFTEPTGRSAL